MNNEEATQTSEKLKKILRDQGLGWVCDEVVEEIRLGKITEKQVDTFKEVPREDRRYGLLSPSIHIEKGPKATLTTIDKFTPQEQLTILVSAVERAVVETVDLETQVGSFFSQSFTDKSTGTKEEIDVDEMTSATEVHFVRPEERQRDTIASASQSKERSAAAAKLRGLLAELRKDI
jgi:hypothetical protein